MFAKSFFYFLLSALLEVGGGYLVWIWLKEGKSFYLGILGFICLALYGVVATLQVANFGKVYAAYGGVFVLFSILWACYFDHFKPDFWDLMGALFVLIGIYFIMYAPRVTTNS